MTNIAEILKDYPSGTKLYSPICGECELVSIEKNSENLTTIIVQTKLSFWDNEYCDFTFMEDGRSYYEGECLLFPSKENRDWSMFENVLQSKHSDVCGDNRFEIIEKAKKDLLDSTNINTSQKEMDVIDRFLFRCWQMKWLNKYDTNKKE